MQRIGILDGWEGYQCPGRRHFARGCRWVMFTFTRTVAHASTAAGENRATCSKINLFFCFPHAPTCYCFLPSISRMFPCAGGQWPGPSDPLCGCVLQAHVSQPHSGGIWRKSEARKWSESRLWPVLIRLTACQLAASAKFAMRCGS